MDVSLQAQFKRIEGALETLVDAIATYNPSTHATSDFIAANDDLGRGLDQLTQHQDNYARIQALRAQADTLEAQLRASVATLASLRRELFETPATTFSDNSRPVPVHEVLQYAKNISQYTVPPTYREPIPTPPPHHHHANNEAASTPANEHATLHPSGETPNDVTAEEAEWLKKLKESNTAWTPWPSDEKIRGSNLMQIQYCIDTGRDPTQVDLTKLAEEEKEEIAANAQRAADQAAAVQPTEMPVQSMPRPAVARPVDTFKGFEFVEDDEDE
ncbi:hypothetical protein CC80DRAFT_520618 [Byssothecium circinans]|uniref:Mediator of RNA polymerase II transcription subunit 4 n=1 Tax=Byssothecium circinans TaxID=147558 RepID=A0A6A5TJY4_9PLEO|nr:hypothetical protein CC80DRAFT_520618 [Byssothecium circinans]